MNYHHHSNPSSTILVNHKSWLRYESHLLTVALADSQECWPERDLGLLRSWEKVRPNTSDQLSVREENQFLIVLVVFSKLLSGLRKPMKNVKQKIAACRFRLWWARIIQRWIMVVWLLVLKAMVLRIPQFQKPPFASVCQDFFMPVPGSTIAATTVAPQNCYSSGEEVKLRCNHLESEPRRGTPFGPNWVMLGWVWCLHMFAICLAG